MTHQEHSLLDQRLLPLTRRRFMIGAAGLTFGIAANVPAGVGAATSEEIVVNPWVTIVTDGTIRIMSPSVEMGQGALTSVPLILAEELDADWDNVDIVLAPPIKSIYGNSLLGGDMYTAGSTSIQAYYKPLRQFGAQVRRVLLENAAQHWGVPVEELTTEPSVVVHAKSGRRLDYGAVASFTKVPDEAPEITESELKSPDKFRLIGTDIMRRDLPSKINGTAQYSIDVRLKDMLYGTIVRAPVQGSAPIKIDDAAARAISGVVEVIPLDYGVGVVAETPWAAFAAKEALQVSWSDQGVAWGFNSEDGWNPLSQIIRSESPKPKPWEEAGDVTTALKQADETYEAEYRCDFAYHAQMEPLNSVALVSAAGDKAEIWCGTQSQNMAVDAAAKALELPAEAIKLNDMLLGGGFGRRGNRDEEFVVDSVLLANQMRGRPVKVHWTREDDVQNGRFRPMPAHYLRGGVNSSGKLIALHHRKAGDGVASFQDPGWYEWEGKRDIIEMTGLEIRPYGVPNVLAEYIQHDSGMRTSPLRAIGAAPNTFAIESFIDEIVTKRGLDPVDYRLELLKDTPRATAVVETVAKAADWGRKRDGRGLGFAYRHYAYKHNSGSHIGMVAEVSVDQKTGVVKIHNIWASFDCGVAVQPDNVVAQTEGCIIYGLGLALSERITVENGQVQESNFYDYFVPRMKDVPNIHVDLIVTPNDPTGAGQMAVPNVAPAIANAVAAATGVRLRHIPMTPERVLAALETQ